MIGKDDPWDLNATPIQICGSAIGRLSDVWDEIADRIGKGKGLFIEEIFGGIWDDGNTGEAFEEELRNWADQPEDIQSLGILQTIFVTCAYACQAMKAQVGGDMLTAWFYTRRCSYWLGVVIGSWSVRSTMESPKTAFAKLGAAARHAENRAMKKEVQDWLDANMTKFKSMDKAAEAIAGKVSPISFRTARDWVGEWRKLRSPGKA